MRQEEIASDADPDSTEQKHIRMALMRATCQGQGMPVNAPPAAAYRHRPGTNLPRATRAHRDPQQILSDEIRASVKRSRRWSSATRANLPPAPDPRRSLSSCTTLAPYSSEPLMREQLITGSSFAHVRSLHRTAKQPDAKAGGGYRTHHLSQWPLDGVKLDILPSARSPISGERRRHVVNRCRCKMMTSSLPALKSRSSTRLERHLSPVVGAEFPPFKCFVRVTVPTADVSKADAGTKPKTSTANSSPQVPGDCWTATAGSRRGQSRSVVTQSRRRWTVNVAGQMVFSKSDLHNPTLITCARCSHATNTS